MILSLYDRRTEIYSQNDSDEKIVLFFVTANQQREWLTVTSEKTSFIAASEWTNDVFSAVKSDRTRNHLTFGAKTGKPPFYFQDVEKV